MPLPERQVIEAVPPGLSVESLDLVDVIAFVWRYRVLGLGCLCIATGLGITAAFLEAKRSYVYQLPLTATAGESNVIANDLTRKLNPEAQERVFRRFFTLSPNFAAEAQKAGVTVRGLKAMQSGASGEGLVPLRVIGGDRDDVAVFQVVLPFLVGQQTIFQLYGYMSDLFAESDVSSTKRATHVESAHLLRSYLDRFERWANEQNRIQLEILKMDHDLARRIDKGKITGHGRPDIMTSLATARAQKLVTDVEVVQIREAYVRLVGEMETARLFLENPAKLAEERLKTFLKDERVLETVVPPLRQRQPSSEVKVPAVETLKARADEVTTARLDTHPPLRKRAVISAIYGLFVWLTAAGIHSFYNRNRLRLRFILTESRR